MEKVVFDKKYRGPPPFAHGGVVSGALIKNLGGITRVLLKAPTPRLTSLEVLSQPGACLLMDGDKCLLEATSVDSFNQANVPSVALSCSAEIAKKASAKYDVFRNQVHPGCYCCETGEHSLNVRCGPRDDAEKGWLAAFWTPPSWAKNEKGKVEHEHLIAALDCPGWHVWRDIEENFPLCFLGTITAEVTALPTNGEPLILCAWPIEGGNGRKRFSGSALMNLHGKCIARAEHIWIKMA